MLGIDLGASSGRGIIGSFDGEKLEIKENHRFLNEPVIQNGRFSWDILRIFHEIKNSIRKCVLEGDEITTVGIDTWGVDYGLLDKNGHLIGNPVHYRDTRTDGIEEYVEKICPLSDIYAKTGIQSLNFNTIYQLVAEQRFNPGLLEYADKMLFTPDLLGYFLTGNMATEYTISSTGAVLDANTKTYATELFGKLGIPERLFVPIVQPGYGLGALLPQVLEETGRTDAKVVKIASHDTASAVLAVPSKEDSFVYISSGTWSLMGTELRSPIISAEASKLGFTNEGGAGGSIRFLKNIMGLWLIQESRRQWKREGKEYSFAELSSLAISSEPRKCFINPDDKLFAPPGNMPERIREYCKKTGQYVPETVGEVVRCIVESLALKYRNTVESISCFMPQKPKAIHIVGGGCQDKLLCALTAAACDLPVYAGPVEATAIGNISMQAIAQGELKNVSEARELVSRSFEMEVYEPSVSDASAFDEAYDRFLNICK
ncbi:MAG: rhamnulokinase [Clostridia bacterium]|nr:rhamnulokinase [Clostridia bacterium]